MGENRIKPRLEFHSTRNCPTSPTHVHFGPRKRGWDCSSALRKFCCSFDRHLTSSSTTKQREHNKPLDLPATTDPITTKTTHKYSRSRINSSHSAETIVQIGQICCVFFCGSFSFAIQNISQRHSNNKIDECELATLPTLPFIQTISKTTCTPLSKLVELCV